MRAPRRWPDTLSLPAPSCANACWNWRSGPQAQGPSYGFQIISELRNYGEITEAEYFALASWLASAEAYGRLVDRDQYLTKKMVSFGRFYWVREAWKRMVRLQRRELHVQAQVDEDFVAILRREELASVADLYLNSRDMFDVIVKTGLGTLGVPADSLPELVEKRASVRLHQDRLAKRMIEEETVTV